MDSSESRCALSFELPGPSLSRARCDVRNALSRAGIDAAAFEADNLVKEASGLERSKLLSEPDSKLTSGQWLRIGAMLSRRLSGEPLAYILGRWEFYGLEFEVDNRVLIPRPETELLVDMAIDALAALKARGIRSPVVADVGTGSGCVAVAIAASVPEARVYATDISREALEVAGANCVRNGVRDRVALLHGDLLASPGEPLDLIVANLPYIETQQLPGLVKEISFEPAIALDGGDGGMTVISRLLGDVAALSHPPGQVLIEVGAGQARRVSQLVLDRLPGWTAAMRKDLSAIDRVVAAIREP